MEKRESLRSCIGCRSIQDKGRLLRYVLSPESELVLDYNSKLPGRGCYVCADVNCLDSAIKKRAFQRALKNNSIVFPGETKDFVSTILERAYGKIASFLSFAARSKKIALGTVAVEQELKKGRVVLLLLSSEMTANVIEKWLSRLKGCINCKIVKNFDLFDSIIGSRKIVGIKDEGLALEIISEIQIVEKLDLNVL